MNSQRELLAALDLGSTMTRVLVAEVLETGGESTLLRYAGFGEAPSEGWRKGNIADLDQVTHSVASAVEQAAKSAGAQIESVVAGVGGAQIQGLTSRVGWTLSQRSREVTRDDIRQLLEAARNIPLQKDRELLHLVPQEFVLDTQEDIHDPMGMKGMHLEAKVHLITTSTSASQHVVSAVNKAGVLVETLVWEALAAGEALLTPEERELGALVAVVGNSSCEIVAYRRDGLCASASMPIGGNHFTGDIAVGLHTALADAEVIKRNFGSISPSWSHSGATFEVPGVGNRPSRFVRRGALNEILDPRAHELFDFMQEELRRFGAENSLGGGVVFTGGGAKLHGICDFAEKFFHAPVRIGLPARIEGMPDLLESPEYATLTGLLLYGQRIRRLRNPRPRPLASRWKTLLGRTIQESVR